MSISSIDGGSEFLERIKWKPVAIFDKDNATDFSYFDFHCLRLAYWAEARAPPMEEVVHSEEQRFECNAERGNGEVCGLVFATKRALLAHLRFSTSSAWV